MKHILTLLVFLISVNVMAQEDPKYLEGAVPEVNGKVQFSTKLMVNQPKAAVYQGMLKWAETLSARPTNIENHTRVGYTDEAKGEIVVVGEEWMVFSSGALSLDRTRVYYTLRMICEDNLCNIYLTNLRYLYNEGRDAERMSAEEQITDKVTLTKDKKKLFKGYAKFRRKTIDLKDELFSEASKAFGSQTITTAKLVESTPVVVETAKPVEVVKPAEVTKPVEVVKPAEVVKPVEVVKPAEAVKPAEKENVAVHIAPPLKQEIAKDLVTFTLQAGSPTAELLQKTGKATFTIISENGTAQVLQFTKIKEEKSADGTTCTFQGELSK